MPINSRAKGASSEREFAALVYQWAGIRLIRNLEQCRSGGHDLSVHPDDQGAVADAFRRLAIEIKRYGKATPGLIRQWYTQAQAQAQAQGLTPVLAFREDRQDWQVVMPLSLVNADLNNRSEFDYTARLSVNGFLLAIREC
jgi:hypothetical protein